MGHSDGLQTPEGAPDRRCQSLGRSQLRGGEEAPGSGRKAEAAHAPQHVPEVQQVTWEGHCLVRRLATCPSWLALRQSWRVASAHLAHSAFLGLPP